MSTRTPSRWAWLAAAAAWSRSISVPITRAPLSGWLTVTSAVPVTRSRTVILPVSGPRSTTIARSHTSTLARTLSSGRRSRESARVLACAATMFSASIASCGLWASAISIADSMESSRGCAAGAAGSFARATSATVSGTTAAESRRTIRKLLSMKTPGGHHCVRATCTTYAAVSAAPPSMVEVANTNTVPTITGFVHRCDSDVPRLSRPSQWRYNVSDLTDRPAVRPLGLHNFPVRAVLEQDGENAKRLRDVGRGARLRREIDVDRGPADPRRGLLGCVPEATRDHARTVVHPDLCAQLAEDPLDREAAANALAAAPEVEGVGPLAERLGEGRAARECGAHGGLELVRAVAAIGDRVRRRHGLEDGEPLGGGVVDRSRPVHGDDQPLAVDRGGQLGDREATPLATGRGELELLGDPRVAALLADGERARVDGEATGGQLAEIAGELRGDRVAALGDLVGIDAERERPGAEQGRQGVGVGVGDRGALGRQHVVDRLARLDDARVAGARRISSDRSTAALRDGRVGVRRGRHGWRGRCGWRDRRGDRLIGARGGLGGRLRGRLRARRSAGRGGGRRQLGGRGR